MRCETSRAAQVILGPPLTYPAASGGYRHCGAPEVFVVGRGLEPGDRSDTGAVVSGVLIFVVA